MAYTSAEIQAKIDKFLPTSVVVPHTSINTRDVRALRDDVFALLSTTFLLHSNSLFYLVFLVRNQMLALQKQLLLSSSAMIADAPGVTRRFKKVESTAELTNAKAALLEVGTGANARTVGIGVKTLDPAVTRFRKAVDQFTETELRKNVVVNNQPVATAEELRVTINSAWEDLQQAHEQLLVLVLAVTEVLAEFQGVAIPQLVLQQIVTKIQSAISILETVMAGPGAATASKDALLELIVAKMLLTRVSAAQGPRLKLWPGTGDSSTTTLSGGEAAAEGTLTGTVSGPFNIPFSIFSTTTIAFKVGTPESTVVVALPRYSNAVIDSVALVEPGGTDFGVSAFKARFNQGVVVGPIAVLGFNTAGAVAVTLNGTPAFSAVATASVTPAGPNNILRISSNSPGDASAIEFLLEDGSQRQFVTVAGFPTYTAGRGVQAQEIIGVVGSATAIMKVVEQRTPYGSASGVTVAGGGNESLLDFRVSQGVDLQLTAGSVIASSPSKHLQSLGVRPGMVLEVLSPPLATGLYPITAVAGNVLTLGNASPVSATATYAIGQDFRGVPVGATVQVTGSTRNTAVFRAGFAWVGYVIVDREFPVRPDSVTASFYTSYLQAVGVGVEAGSGIRVPPPPTAGSIALGFSTSLSLTEAEADTLSVVAGNFLDRGVQAGDLVFLDGLQHVITAVSPQQLQFTPPHPYSTPTVLVHSGAVTTYNSVVAGLESWNTTYGSLAELERLARVVAAGGKPDQLLSALTTYQTGLSTLAVVLTEYVIAQDPGIDNILRMLAEQGMDRALDLLLQLQLQELFSMPPEGVSYSSWLSRKAADTTRAVTPTDKGATYSQTGLTDTRLVSSQPDPFQPTTGRGRL